MEVFDRSNYQLLPEPYEPIHLMPGQTVISDPDGLLQAQKEEQPKKTAPRKRKLDSLSDWPGFQAVKR